ncbi:ADP-ribosylation factor 6-like [Littorina saxatilis]|uniref:ADP-ribosylation factor n=1 Tax=Littorina saxatilis TaxID=31220 RepID=A0AAN9BN29_9CAEN
MGNALCTLFRHRSVKVLYFGLDAAGKTTLLYRLKLGEIVTTIPTMSFNLETVNHNGLDMVTWDVGSRDKSRAIYRHFTVDMDASIFVVDSSDHERLGEAVDEFIKHIVPHAEELQVPIVVLANKQDVASAMTPEVVREAINSKRSISTDMEVFPTTALTFVGVNSALDWLTSKLAAKLARESYFPLVSSAALGKMMQYPVSIVKSSFLRVTGLFDSDDQSEAGVRTATT